jgi:vacuolar protein sorting-associated protein 3
MTGSRRQGQRGGSTDRSGLETPDNIVHETSPATSPIAYRRMSAQRETSPTKNSSLPDKPLPVTPEPQTPDQPTAPKSPPVYLKPHIVSPSPHEFLLVMGARPSDPGVGMFINLDGEVTRSTLKFERYPDELATDGRGIGNDLPPQDSGDDEEGYVLATMCRNINQRTEYGLEIQRWDLDPGEGETQKFWLRMPNILELDDSVQQGISKPGIRSVVDAGEIMFDEVVERLRLKRFRPFSTKSIDASTLSLQSADSRTATSLERVSKERELFESQDMPDGWEENRNNEEWEFARRLGRARSRIVVWSGNKMWWAVRNPLVLRLDASLESAIVQNSETPLYLDLDRRKAIEVINSLRGREAKTETEYLSLAYIRQRAGLLLLISIINSPSTSDIDHRVTEEALSEGGLDPRVPLALIPLLRNEIVESKTGIWVHGGVKLVAQDYILDIETSVIREIGGLVVNENVLQFYRRFLTAWRQKKGFGSVADENEVFRSIDAALLVVLLQLDKISVKGPAKAKIRSELNTLVDHGIDCFERAISILEAYHRLYVLSRLYQSRKMAKEVLFTWRRIAEGELDEGGEFSEQKIGEYLRNVKNPALVQEYGVWLANRNPYLGVQVFAEEQSKVKFEPTQVVEILRHGAPGAVKDYLEHLVFGKNHTEYVSELIAYYLDIVIHKLETSEEAREILSRTYESYRALRPPKPTYRQFITDNAIQDEWWHSRLRLLQLLGGSHESASEYDVASILTRIEPFTQELVPEVIILDGRQSHHKEALKLLTHGLGDFDTAINYCLLGGSSIYHPVSRSRVRENLPSREEQSKLFEFLLVEFLRIKDISDRVEQTGSLLERFGSWFDIEYALRLIPDTWSVELVSGFLASALRRIVRERSETLLAKALSGSENLKINADLIDKIEEIGPSIEAQTTV